MTPEQREAALRLAEASHLGYRVGWQRETAALLRELASEPEMVASDQTQDSHQPQAEPVAYLRQTSSDRNPPHGWAVHFLPQDGDMAVYTHPPQQRQPLTDEQISKRLWQAEWPEVMLSDFVRAKLVALIRVVEAAHGITGSKE